MWSILLVLAACQPAPERGDTCDPEADDIACSPDGDLLQCIGTTWWDPPEYVDCGCSGRRMECYG